MELDSDGDLHLVAAPNASPALIEALGELMPKGRTTSPGDGLGDAENLVMLAPASRLFGRHSCWRHPIWHEGKLLGAFALTSPEDTEPDAPMKRLLEHGAAIAGVILQASHLQAEDERQRRRLRRLAHFHAMLAQANQVAATLPDEMTLYAEICRIAVAHGDFRLAWIGAPDERQRFTVFAAAGMSAYLEDIVISANPALPEGRGPAGQAWRSGEVVVSPRITRDNEYAPWFEQARRFNLSAAATLPLRNEGQVVALLLVYAEEEGVFDPELVAILKELAFDTGRALEAIGQRRRLERLQALHNALLAESELLLHGRYENDMLNELCERLVQHTLFQVAWIARPDAEGIIQTLAAAGADANMLDELTLRLDEVPPSLVVSSWKADQPAHDNDYVASSRERPWHDFLRQKQWHSVAAIPIHRGGAIFGILALVSAGTNLFDAEVLALCERIAQLLGHALDELDLKNRLEREKSQQFHLARHDPLTGLPNRLQFEEYLLRAIARARRQQTLLAVGLLDLDDFKPVNDTWGHLIGDMLLRQLSERLRALLRESDLLARFGGDEFVLAIEGLNTSDSLPAVLNRLRSAVETPFNLGDGRVVSITFSLGVALIPEDGTEPDLLLRRADAALYQTKAGKIRHHRWWHRWREGVGADSESVLVLPDAYGPEAATLLASSQTLSVAVAEDFINEFYRHLTNHPQTSAVLQFVVPDELSFIKAQQIQSLVEVLTPGTSREPFQKTARFLGRLYALTNIDCAMIAQGVGLYQNLLSQRLAAFPLRTADRERLISVINTRLQDLTAAHLQAHGQTMADYHALLVHPPPSAGTLWVDGIHSHMEMAAALPGIVGVELLRLDAHGAFQIEAASGAAAGHLLPIWHSDSLAPLLDINQPQGRGLVAAAWRTRELQTCANYALDPRVAPWRDTMREARISSGAVLPVHDVQGRPVFVLVLFGSYPGQFESLWMRQFCTGLMQRLTLIWQQSRVTSTDVVPKATAEIWRQRLFSGGLTMYYQPLVNLRSGRPVMVEALTRLVLEDGSIVAPAQFLSVLGERDLDRLFRLALLEALRQLKLWDAAGVHLSASVNLPPPPLLQPDCPLWVQEALATAKIEPRRLYLEIMETGRVDENETLRDAILHRLSHMGVHIVMDDLGSGYSSLQRLRSLPFHAVKVDQSLVRDVWRDPIRVLGLIGALVQLGRDLELDVVVEGLESEEMVEAAAILRAKMGQGYALARPMPAAALLGWMEQFDLNVDRTAPRTALGALAALWRFEHGGGENEMPAERPALGSFIVARNLQGSPLDSLHRQQDEIARAEGIQSAQHQALAAQIRTTLLAMCAPAAGD